METINREEARRLVTNGREVTVVEVLDSDRFGEFHLPGAINVPFDENFDEHMREAVPDKSRAVLVYCHDAECSASAEAAARLDELDYAEVYDYEPGKIDWNEAGLPVET
ncbi:MAG: rhodanese-like domain-containing protein [Planctomycetaceae bacterium]